MAFYFAKLTAAGAALLAAAAAPGGVPVPLLQMKIGDAGGTAYDPTGAEGGLVNVRDTQGLDSAGVDSVDGTVYKVTAIFPAANGNFTVREAGVYTASGVLFGIARHPDFFKPDPSSGAGVDLVVTLQFRFSGSANITCVVDPSTQYATRTSVWLARHYYALKAAPATTPPATPSEADVHLVPNTGATGAWVGHSNQIAISAAGGWVFISPPIGTRVAVPNTTTVYRKDSAGWVLDSASGLEASFTTLKARRRLFEKELTDFTFLPTTQRALTTTLTDIGPQGAANPYVPTGKVWVADVRIANVGSADHFADLKIVDTGIVDNSNDGYRAKNFPVGFSEAGSAPDFERKLILTAGQKLQAKASANSQLVISIVWLQADAGIFLATTQRAVAQATMNYLGPHGAASVRTPAGKVRTLTLRACNIGAVDGTLDLKIVDETTGLSGANDGFRNKSFPVPYATAASAPDFELVLVLTADQKLGYQGSADNLIAISGEWAEDNV